MTEHSAAPAAPTRDRIYRDAVGPTQPFVFDEKVAAAFDDMALRSIPNYRETLRLSAQLVSDALGPATRIYDLGASTGALAEIIAPGLRALGASYVGVDTSEAMVQQARTRLRDLDKHAEFIVADATHLAFEPARAVVANYCLQFTPVERRDTVLARIFEALDESGVFVFSEKVLGSSPTEEAFVTRQYEAFKKAAGYSDEEIRRKREALRGVLRPLSLEANLSMLYAAGFEAISVPIRWMNFATFVAWKRAPNR